MAPGRLMAATQSDQRHQELRAGRTLRIPQTPTSCVRRRTGTCRRNPRNSGQRGVCSWASCLPVQGSFHLPHPWTLAWSRHCFRLLWHRDPACPLTPWPRDAPAARPPPRQAELRARLLGDEDLRLEPGPPRGQGGARAARAPVWGPFPPPETAETGLRVFSPSFDVVEKRALGLHSEGQQRDLENKGEPGQGGAGPVPSAHMAAGGAHGSPRRHCHHPHFIPRETEAPRGQAMRPRTLPARGAVRWNQVCRSSPSCPRCQTAGTVCGRAWRARSS